ncbi:hypothetical protein [Actinacidiphila soli]|uniref:hypothetical protein n=1 Tax=Actinacidiphila soli TaxID=2487275 RepID=UPI000FCC1187|nr:hypothetical protein [Actinacidiphila soli]
MPVLREAVCAVVPKKTAAVPETAGVVVPQDVAHGAEKLGDLLGALTQKDPLEDFLFPAETHAAVGFP